MATEEQPPPPPPVPSLETVGHGSMQAKCDFNMDNLSKTELLTLLSIMEGELEARDLVIETLRARKKEAFVQERYSRYSLADPFQALHRDHVASGGHPRGLAVRSSPIVVLEAIIAHCHKMQERMSAQLLDAENREKKLEQEKQQLQSLEQKHRQLSAQLKDEREKSKHVVTVLVRECKQLAARVLEESQRFDDLSARLQEESRASGRLQEELGAEREKSVQLEARMERQLGELDSECEQLRARLGREEARVAGLQEEGEELRQRVERLQAPWPPRLSVAVATEPTPCQAAACQTDPPAKGAPKQRGLLAPTQTENGDVHASTAPSSRVQAARYKFQSPPPESEQNGADASPSSRARQQARHTVTQVLSRFTGPSLNPTVGLKSPTVGRVDRGNPPPIPPKKPGLSQTPSPPQPPLKPASPAIPSKAANPQVPPKPALDGAVVASQVGASPPRSQLRGSACTSLHRISAPAPCSSQESDSCLATAAGWRPSVTPSLTCGGPVSLADGRTLLLQAATQGNVTLLSTLLNRGPMVADSPDPVQSSALFSASHNGHAECVKVLLTSGGPPDVPNHSGLTSLHIAAAQGHESCVKVLLDHSAEVNCSSPDGQTPLFLACSSGKPECVRVLLEGGANPTLATTNSCTALHAAANSGNVDCLELLLHHMQDLGQDGTGLKAFHNYTDQHGWTAAHIAASKGFKSCLKLLCSHDVQELDKRDKCNRTIHDVATDDCKDLLENLDVYRVLIGLQQGSAEQLCDTDVLTDGSTVGSVAVYKQTGWDELTQCLTHVLEAHFQWLRGNRSLWGRETPLGLSGDSIGSVCIGGVTWTPGHELSQPPWGLVRKPQAQKITVKLKDVPEGALDQLSYRSLIPLRILQNYMRLAEQYRCVILQGADGSCQGDLAEHISLCIKHKLAADLIEVPIDERMSRGHLLEIFLNCGLLVPEKEAAPRHCVVVLLQGLEKACSMWQLLGHVCEGLENRGSVYKFCLPRTGDGLFYFHPGSFVIGTVSQSCLHGPDLLLQQHFRWIQLRWDSEPLSGLLGRHLRRKLAIKTSGRLPSATHVMCKTLGWICNIWHQINCCLACLAAPEAIVGPQVFFSCPVDPERPPAVLTWLCDLWNTTIVPRVEKAIVSHVIMKHSLSQQHAPGTPKLNPGQQTTVKAALRILIDKAILQGCPLHRTVVDEHLSKFQGSSFQLSTLGAQFSPGITGRSGTVGTWKQGKSSPRKKENALSAWSSASLCTFDTSYSRRGSSSEKDQEVDLMWNLRNMYSSKSEPDISKISQVRKDFMMLPSPSSPVSPNNASCDGDHIRYLPGTVTDVSTAQLLMAQHPTLSSSSPENRTEGRTTKQELSSNNHHPSVLQADPNNN